MSNQNLPADAKPGRWKTLAVICSGLFMIMLQSNVINLAVPRIQADFGVDLATVSWITNSYLLVFTIFLLTFGRLGDELGRKKIFAIGLGVYSLGALLCALLPSTSLGVWGIIAGSVVQGLGGAAMMPATQSLIAANFEGKERGMALGLWGAVSGLAVAVGPTLGGYLTDVGLGSAINNLTGITQGWRYIYILSCLIGVIVFVATLRLVPESRDSRARHSYDVVGIILSAVMLFTLVLGLINGSDWGWWEKKAAFVLFGTEIGLGTLSVTPLFFLVALATGVLFVLWEKNRKNDPLMDLGFFANRNFTAGSIVAAILNFSMMGCFFLIPVFLQGILKYSAIQTGLVMLPMALAVMVVSPLTGKLTDVLGPKWTIALGMLVMAAGSFLTAGFTTGTTPAELILPFIVLGAGIALAMSPITNAALSTVNVDETGGASGLLSTTRQLGSILGIAILASLFSTFIPVYAERNVSAIEDSVVPGTVKEKIVEGLHSGGGQQDAAAMDQYLGFYKPARREAMKQAVGTAMTQSVIDSINTTFRYGASVALLGAFAALFMKNRRKGGQAEAGTPAAQDQGGQA